MKTMTYYKLQCHVDLVLWGTSISKPYPPLNRPFTTIFSHFSINEPSGNLLHKAVIILKPKLMSPERSNHFNMNHEYIGKLIFL